MNILPVLIKFLLNIVIYCIYLAISWLAVGIIMGALGHAYENGSEDSKLIGMIVVVIVALVTILYRKFFYVSLKKNK